MAESAVRQAVGTQRNFSKRPEALYQPRLEGVSGGDQRYVRQDYDVQRLTSALGLMNKNINAEIEAQKQREKDQATLVNADKLLYGKSAEDLAKFDRVAALQNASDQFDLTDNPYAIAVLDKATGKMAASYAKESLSENPRVMNPTSVEDALAAYKETLDGSYGSFAQGSLNHSAFDDGFYAEAVNQTTAVADTAFKAINDRKRKELTAATVNDITDVVASGMRGNDFAVSITPRLRQLQLGCRTNDDFIKEANTIGEMIADKDYDTDRLNTFLDNADMNGNPIRNSVDSYKLYKKVANNFNYKVSDSIANKAMRADGSIDRNVVEAELKKLPREAYAFKVPSVPIKNGSEEHLNYVGGILATCGVDTGLMSVNLGSTPESTSIYIGKQSVEDRINIKNKVSKYYDSVGFDSEGNMTISGYKGNIRPDMYGNPKEASASAYSEKRVRQIGNLIQAKYSYAMTKKQEEYDAKEYSTADAILKLGGDKTEVIKTLNNSGLPESTQKEMMAAWEHYRVVGAIGNDSASVGVSPEMLLGTTKKQTIKDNLAKELYWETVGAECVAIASNEYNKPYMMCTPKEMEEIRAKAIRKIKINNPTIYNKAMDAEIREKNAKAIKEMEETLDVNGGELPKPKEEKPSEEVGWWEKLFGGKKKEEPKKEAVTPTNEEKKTETAPSSEEQKVTNNDVAAAAVNMAIALRDLEFKSEEEAKAAIASRLNDANIDPQAILDMIMQLYAEEYNIKINKES